MERWEKVRVVQRMQLYIEEHLCETITLHQLAGAAGYSPWHAARLFKDLTGKAPFDYIRALRLSQAAVRLREPQHPKIVDVAFDFVFDSHEGFTRAFSKYFGISPLAYSKSGDALTQRLFLPNTFRDCYLNLQKGVNSMENKTNANTVFVQVIDRPARKVLLKRGIKATDYFGYCDEVGCEIWETLERVKEALYEPIGMWLPKNLRRPGTSEYVQGVEVAADYDREVPEGLEVMELPPCKMMVFQGQPYEDDHFMDAIGELWEVMKKYQPEVYGFQWADEDGPRFQLAPMGYRGYIEARPVRQLNVK